MSLAILYPNGQVMACQMYIWDVMTLSPVVWDGSVTFSGTITLGTVDQGAAGTDPWLVELSGASTVSVNNFPATQPVSLASIPNPSNLDVALSTRTKPSDQQHTIIDSSAVIHTVIDSSASIAVTGPLTDTQLRATPVPISGTVSTGGLTDTQLRATPVPISGTVTATVPNPLPISVASLPLPSNAAQESGGNLATLAGKDFATQTTLAQIKTNTDNLVPNAYKTFYQGQLSNSVGVLATVPALKSWRIRDISVVNTDSSDHTAGLYRNGTTSPFLVTPSTMNVLAGGMWKYDGEIDLEAGGTIAGIASVASKVTVTISGDEVG